MLAEQDDRNAMKIESNSAELADLYLDIMKKCLTRYIFPEPYRRLRRPPRATHPVAWAVYPPISAILERNGLRLYRLVKFEPMARAEGRDWPAEADTMIGLKRLDNVHSCI